MKDMTMADALQAEQRTVNVYGQVFLEGMNWQAPELLEHPNQRMHLLLDVIDGELLVRVYSLTGQFICNAKREDSILRASEFDALLHEASANHNCTMKGATQ